VKAVVEIVIVEVLDGPVIETTLLGLNVIVGGLDGDGETFDARPIVPVKPLSPVMFTVEIAELPATRLLELEVVVEMVKSVTSTNSSVAFVTPEEALVPVTFTV